MISKLRFNFVLHKYLKIKLFILFPAQRREPELRDRHLGPGLGAHLWPCQQRQGHCPWRHHGYGGGEFEPLGRHFASPASDVIETGEGNREEGERGHSQEPSCEYYIFFRKTSDLNTVRVQEVRIWCLENFEEKKRLPILHYVNKWTLYQRCELRYTYNSV